MHGPHYIVLGAGAIGCYVGGRLAAGGADVSLVGRSRFLEAIATHGLQLSDLDGWRAQVGGGAFALCASLNDAMGQAGNQPVVILLCVKGGSTQAAAGEIAAACPPGTVVVSLQNGVDNVARVQAAAPAMQVLAGMVSYNVTMPDEHTAHRGTAGLIHVQRHALTSSFAAAWNAAGLGLALEDDMQAVQWGKLLLNLNNPVNALTDMPLREQLLDRDCRRVLAALQDECLRALQRAGIRPARIAAVSPHILPKVLRLPDWLFSRLAQRMLRIDAHARSSMWDDLHQGRPTEIDDFCGAVVRLARAHGASAPLNAAMLRLFSQWRSGQRYSGTELLRALGA